MQFELVDIQEQTGSTFIMVTHDQEEAMTMSTRIGIMSDGWLEQVSPPTEIYEFPNAQIEKHYTNGSKEIQYADGTTKHISSTGREAYTAPP